MARNPEVSKANSIANEHPQPTIPEGHIGFLEVIGVIVLSLTAKAFLAFPERVARSAETAGWSVPIASALLSSSWLIPLVIVLRAHPGKNMVEITKKLLGKPAGFFFGLFFFLQSIALSSTASYQVGSTLVTTVLPLTPETFVLCVGILVSLYISYEGIEVMSRLNVLAAALLLGSLILVIGLTLPQWKMGEVKPLLGPGLLTLSRTYITGQAMFEEILVIGFLASYVREERQFGQATFWGTALSAFALSTVVFGAQVLLTFPRLLQQSAPFLRIARLVYLGRFFQRFDAVFIFVWLGSGAARLAIGFWTAAHALAASFGLKVYKPMLPISAVAAFVVTMLIPNLSSAVVLDFDIIRPYSLPVIVAWCWLLFGVNLFRQRKSQEARRDRA